MSKRVIKFRAWNGKEMDNTPYGDGDESGVCNINDSLAEYTSNPKWILMQFTGILDKNNKEIYEGDIVKFFTNYPQLEENIELVYYSDYEGNLYPRVEGCCVLDGGSSEVIGNIHENSDIVK